MAHPKSVPNPTWRVAALLFLSGGCALVYQVGWLREFRLIFGASTAASAAVLAIFIGGLGVGGLLLGPRADSHRRPILFYAQLEAIVAISAALSPFLLTLVRSLYVAAGGTARLGMGGGTIVRLILSGVVLAIPTIAMGGTLPAAARGIIRRGDARRQDVAALYALNALGAVFGCGVATFFMLETFGTRQTLWLAAAVNLLVAMLARQLDRTLPADAERPEEEQIKEDEMPAEVGRQAPPAFVLLASGVVGFAFFLMELVWYRMLGPLLGGSVFTFGLILSVALAGIGVGGLLYALVGRDRRATLSGFAWSCLLEAAAIAAAYAVGDRLALLALVLQALGHAAFMAQVAGWAAVTSIVVFPAAVVAGYQFPMLIALLGRGRQKVGRQIGLAYATNTVGAIVGALAGGFGLLPWLSAPGAWKFAAGSLVALGAAAVALGGFTSRQRTALAQLALAAVTVALLTTVGPTAVWRHAGIGAGRADMTSIASANQLEDWRRARRRAVVWDGDGTESSVALSVDSAGYAFVVNGKSDGSARRDAATQVMLGLLGAILQPDARRSLVIGLGTGSTAGWLGAIPGMERVDVVELEPLILEIAKACRAVNHDVLDNPKVHIALGDARETLLTTSNQYDIIASEPSNPFRAGIASLFTREYYAAATDRLTPNGLFIQWVQAYDIDSRTLRTIYATMSSVFPYIDTWQTTHGDLLLVGSMRPHTYSTKALAGRIAEEPFKTALRGSWRAVDIHGFLAHFVANASMAQAIAAAPNVALNTDDRNVVEFGFARTVGVSATILTSNARALAGALDASQPRLDNPAAIDWPAVDTSWIGYAAAEAGVAVPAGGAVASADENARRLALVSYYVNGNSGAARLAWARQTAAPRDQNELAMLADINASMGDDQARAYIEKLRPYDAGEADTILAILRARQSRFDEAATALESAFAQYQKEPWALLSFKQRAIDLANDLGSRSPQLAGRMWRALDKPFAVEAMREQRWMARVRAAQLMDFKNVCRETLAPFEPQAPWTSEFLEARRACYEAHGDSRVEIAARDLIALRGQQPLPLGTGVR